MKNPTHRFALYTATILISALPFTADATDRTKKQHSTIVKNQVRTCLVQDENSGRPIDLNTLKARFDQGLD